MKAPLRPANERERLAVLREYDILDAPPEPALDAITRVVAQLLDVPIALVSILDVDRQWFASRHGLHVQETPREVSFCGHVVEADAALVVPDAHADPRFADNPLVTGDPHVRFYAGAPLRTPDGFVLGTLCAIDRRPRELTEKERALLAVLAEQVVAQLELRRKTRQIAADRAALADSDAKNRAMLDGMAEGMVVRNARGEFTSCNRAAERILGVKERDLAKRSVAEERWRFVRPDGTPMPPDDHPAMVALRTGEPVSDVRAGLPRSDGLRWLNLSARALVRAGETRPYAAVVTFRDITGQLEAEAERDALREELAQSDRLVVAGALAGGVGHEINNPLSYATSNVEFAIEALGDGAPDLRDALVEAREGLERIGKIVRALRAFARQERTTPHAVDVQAAIDVSLNMAMHELRSKATVSTELGPIPGALADESRLSQVLVNLLVNAAQAFQDADPSKNRVVIRTRVLTDDRVAIEVRDNGPGIPPETLPRIYDPFFTTKTVGKGSGLGLAVCHTIVTSLGGTLMCDTMVGEGTTFTIALPAAPPASARSGLRPRGRVLVVDDEESVLRAVTRLLQAEHEVVTLSDPREALKLLEKDSAFDVVFCDLMMPHITGVALFGRVRERDPDLARRFVFITGGIIHEDVREFLSAVPNERLEKPFTMKFLRDLTGRYVRKNAA